MKSSDVQNHVNEDVIKSFDKKRKITMPKLHITLIYISSNYDRNTNIEKEAKITIHKLLKINKLILPEYFFKEYANFITCKEKLNGTNYYQSTRQHDDIKC